LRRLIETDSRNGEVGYLDGDPFCDCQDSEGLKTRVLSMKISGSSAVAMIENYFPKSFAAADRRNVVILHLQKVRGAWKVGDVSSKRTPSLTTAIRKADTK
jgi:hypothetical protein